MWEIPDVVRNTRRRKRYKGDKVLNGNLPGEGWTYRQYDEAIPLAARRSGRWYGREEAEIVVSNSLRVD